MLDEGRAETFAVERAEALDPATTHPTGVRLVGGERRPRVPRVAPTPAPRPARRLDAAERHRRDRERARRAAAAPAGGRRRLPARRRRRRRGQGAAHRRLRRLPAFHDDRPRRAHAPRRGAGVPDQGRSRLRKEARRAAGLSRQQRRHRGRPGGRRGDAALFRRAFRQCVLRPRFRRDEPARGEGGARQDARADRRGLRRGDRVRLRRHRGRQRRDPRRARLAPGARRNRRLGDRASGDPGARLPSRAYAPRQGPRHPRRPPRPARSRALSRCAHAEGRAGLDHVGQQRDRGPLPGRGARRGGQGGRRVVPHRRRPGGRAPAHRLAKRPRSTCFRCPPTSCTAPRASARSTSGAARPSAR